MTDTDDDTRLL